jgi:hypothetical protein
VKIFLMGMLSVATATTTLLVPAGPASADCVSPRIAVSSTTVHPGERVTATGDAWGDNCYDTGRPPPGLGVLGNPIGDVELVVVQGGRETVVAQGSADAAYGFRVDVVIPGALVPGGAQLLARSQQAAFVPSVTLVVLGSASPTPDSTEAASFGDSVDSLAINASESTDHGARWALLAVTGVAGVLAVAWMVRRRRRSSPG